MKILNVLKENKDNEEFIKLKQKYDPESSKDEIYNVDLISHFDHLGPHGQHLCMLFDIYGVNLLEIIKKYN